jgi:hypothetical protein
MVASNFIAKILSAERNVSIVVDDNDFSAPYWSHHEYHIECKHSNYSRRAQHYQYIPSRLDLYFNHVLAWTLSPLYFNHYLWAYF